MKGRRGGWLMWGVIMVLAGGCAAKRVSYEWGKEAGLEAAGPGVTADETLNKLAREKPEALFARGLAFSRQARDYRCRMMRQERLGGRLTAVQEIEVWFRAEPFSVYFNWLKNPQKAQKILYARGQYSDKMLVLPAGVGWLTGLVLVDPAGKEARESGRRPVTEFGFGATLERLIAPYRSGRLADGGRFEDRYAGIMRVAGQEAVVIERRRKGAAPDAETAAVWRICLDRENLQPVAITEFAADKMLLSHYVFKDIRYNCGLGPGDFTPGATGMKKTK